MYDVVIVGGGTAGLSAALILGRARRRVLVIDGGTPRNTPAEHAHGFLSRDGVPPLELLRIAREELSAYEGVQFQAGQVETAEATPAGFRLVSSEGRQIEARKLIMATGVTDVMPSIPGLAELWGRGVYHCPYCHGWEVRDKRWALLGYGELTFDTSALYAGWASELVVLANGPSDLPEAERQRLASLGAVLDERLVVDVGPIGEDGDINLTFDDGSTLRTGAVFVMAPQVQRSGLPEALGCETYEFAPMRSHYVRADPVTGETSVGGIYAAGDMIGFPQSLILASSSGARAAYALNRTLAMEDAEARVAEAAVA